MEQLEISVIPGARPGIRIVQLRGPFTLSTLFDFQNIVRETGAFLTILDLNGVPYMDSAALGCILGFHASCHREGTRYALIGVSDRLRTLFRVSGVDGLVNICVSMDEASGAAAGL